MESEMEMSGNLPEEIMREILLRLPVKSLLKFRCVSKSWLFLISSSRFIKAHLNFSTNNNVYMHDKLIFGSKSLPPRLYTCPLYSIIETSVSAHPIYATTHQNARFDPLRFDCPFIEPEDRVWVVGSCNGLVCVSLSPNKVVLWNPITRKMKLLPESGTDMEFDYFSVKYGFGYDEVHDDYKVVEVFEAEYENREYKTQVTVYSVRNDSWMVLPDWPNGEIFGLSGLFLNGAIHWSMWDFDNPVSGILLSHDLATDRFVELPLPRFDDFDVRAAIKNLQGCLALSCEHDVYLEVWVMKEYGVEESWTKLIRIHFFLDIWDHDFVTPSPLLFSEDGKILINYGSSLRVYDTRNLAQPHHFDTSRSLEATTYVESLVSPDMDEG